MYLALLGNNACEFAIQIYLDFVSIVKIFFCVCTRLNENLSKTSEGPTLQILWPKNPEGHERLQLVSG